MVIVLFLRHPGSLIVENRTRLGDPSKKYVRDVRDSPHSYCEVVNYLLAKYATKVVRADAVTRIRNCPQRLVRLLYRTLGQYGVNGFPAAKSMRKSRGSVSSLRCFTLERIV